MWRKVVTPSTSTRKRRLKSSFRYSTMKQLEKSREYKRLQKTDKADCRNDKKPARQSKRLLKLSETSLESNDQQALRTPTPFYEFEVLGGSMQMDVEDERGYCASVERGAGSGVFESGEQELLSEFDKYQNSTKNRNLDGNFLPNTLFLVKIGTYYRGCRRLFNPL
jgi:hypothetical protein